MMNDPPEDHPLLIPDSVIGKNNVPPVLNDEIDVEGVRLQFLGRESAIKSIGLLCYLVGFFSLLGTIEFALFAVGVIPREHLKAFLPPAVLDLFFGVFAIAFAINAMAQVALGFGLVRLQPWARWIVVALTGLSLFIGTISSLMLCATPSSSELLRPMLGFDLNMVVIGIISLVVGGGFHLLILWPLIAPGSGMVFSNRYREVIRQSPAIRSRMHWLLKLFVGFLMMLVSGFIAYLAAIYFRIID